MEVRINASELTALIRALQKRQALISDMLGEEAQKEADHQQAILGSSGLRGGIDTQWVRIKGVGDVIVRVLPDPDGEIQSRVLAWHVPHRDVPQEDVLMRYFAGMSARSLSLLSRRLIGRSIAHGKVGETYGELTEAIEQWRNRDLSQKRIKYLYAGDVVLHRRVEGRIEKRPVLLAVGVAENNARLVVGLRGGDKERLIDWRGLFRGLKDRGLDGSLVTLGIMDGRGVLAEAFREEFPNGELQWCQARVTRDVLAQAPRALKKEMGDDLSSIFYASSRERAEDRRGKFLHKWEKMNPSAAKALSRSMDACLTFFAFPEEEWVSLRAANVIQRLSKEFGRRRKLIEMARDEAVMYQLLGFMALRMQLSWRANPLGKVRPNLPSYRIHT